MLCTRKAIARGENAVVLEFYGDCLTPETKSYELKSSRSRCPTWHILHRFNIHNYIPRFNYLHDFYDKILTLFLLYYFDANFFLQKFTLSLEFSQNKFSPSWNVFILNLSSLVLPAFENFSPFEFVQYSSTKANFSLR